MTRKDLGADLVHDVAKYVARVAQNVSGQETEATRERLLPLLLEDLYGGAQARFHELSHVLLPAVRASIEDEFAALIDLQGALRRGEARPFFEACERARRIADAIKNAVDKASPMAKGDAP